MNLRVLILILAAISFSQLISAACIYTPEMKFMEVVYTDDTLTLNEDLILKANYGLTREVQINTSELERIEKFMQSQTAEFSTEQTQLSNFFNITELGFYVGGLLQREDSLEVYADGILIFHAQISLEPSLPCNDVGFYISKKDIILITFTIIIVTLLLAFFIRKIRAK